MARDTTTTPGRRTRAFVAWTLRHGVALWVLAVAIAIPAMMATVGLYVRLNSDIEQLLPRDSQSVLAIHELRARMPGLQYLGVVVDAKTPANLPAAERLIDDLAARVRGYPPDLVRAVKTNADEEKRFVEENAPLYADLADLEAIRDRIADRKRWEYNQKLGISLDDEPPPPLAFDDIARKYEGRAQAVQRLARGRFSDPESATTLLLVEVGGFSTGAAKARELLGRVKKDVAALGGAETYAPGMQLGYAGDVAVSVEEISALEADLTLASLLVVAAVILVILLYFRWWRSVPILFLPLIVAASSAFALASLPPANVTELNSNTAFLGSIIIGNGINFAILLLARYVEARRRGKDVTLALVEAVWGARLGTLVAALAAGVAYASLVVTQFRGFRQFGIIGGLGMVLSWLAAFVLMPPLIAWFDRGPATAPKPRRASRGFMAPFARWVATHPMAIMIGAGVLTLGSLAVLPRLDRSRLETDFSRLRRRDTWTEGEGHWGRKMDRVLGRYLSPTVILTDDPAQARALATALRQSAQRGPLQPLVSEVRNLDTVLPPDAAEKIAVVEAIRKQLSPVTRASVEPARLAQLDRFIGDGPLRPLAVEDLPVSFTTGLREHDRTLGRAVLVFPTLSKAIWNGDNLAIYVGELRRAAANAGGARVAGTLPLSADIVASISRDGPLASLVAFAGVMFLIVLMFRWSVSTIYVVGSLLIGVAWLVAATFVLRVKINFINFIAFPITFGIGVDYAVNVMSRYLQEGGRDIEGPIRSTGAAVGLCSATTIIGYSSLLLAQNQGLFLFGLVAVLGELTCLVTALAVLPAVLQLRARSPRPPRALSEPAAGAGAQ